VARLRAVFAMLETSLSLLDGLRDQADDAAWRRLVDLYAPLIRAWLMRRAVQPQDAEDIAQEVMVVVMRKIPEFDRVSRTGAFRRWLLLITTNCLRDFWRARRIRPTPLGEQAFLEELAALEDPASELTRQWDQEHDMHVVRSLLERIRPDFEPRTWEAFERVTFRGESPAAVAAALGMTVNAVFIAKSRIMKQLRTLGAGLID